MSERFAPPPTEEERFLLALLVIGAMSADYAGTETYGKPEPAKSPYQGHEGQRSGESFTAYRQRVRKEQQQ